MTDTAAKAAFRTFPRPDPPLRWPESVCVRSCHAARHQQKGLQMQNGEIDMPGNERVWTTAEVLRRTGRSPEPGELFWFLYDEWDEVLERQASGRLSLDSMLFATRAMDLRGAAWSPRKAVRWLAAPGPH